MSDKFGTFVRALFLIVLVGGCARSVDKDLVIAAYNGDVARIEALVKQGANPNALAVDGWTPLTIASREGRLDAVKLLLRSGARPNEPEGGGNSALYWAALSDHCDVINVLLADGADVNKKGSSNGAETPLHIALRLHNLDAAEILRQAGGKE